MKIYFAHPFATEGSSAKVVLWALQKAFPDWKFCNPFDSPLTQLWFDSPANKKEQIAKEIVVKDLKLIRRSNAVLAYIPDLMVEDAPSYATLGTAMEIFYARKILGKPVYALTPFYHPWLVALNVKTASNLDELKKMLKEDYGNAE